MTDECHWIEFTMMRSPQFRSPHLIWFGPKSPTNCPECGKAIRVSQVSGLSFVVERPNHD